jgi:hypothetical protein
MHTPDYIAVAVLWLALIALMQRAGRRKRLARERRRAA